jgi:hypothetical protein
MSVNSAIVIIINGAVIVDDAGEAGIDGAVFVDRDDAIIGDGALVDLDEAVSIDRDAAIAGDGTVVNSYFATIVNGSVIVDVSFVDVESISQYDVTIAVDSSVVINCTVVNQCFSIRYSQHPGNTYLGT